jgi:hypothetical protein
MTGSCSDFRLSSFVEDNMLADRLVITGPLNSSSCSCPSYGSMGLNSTTEAVISIDY